MTRAVAFGAVLGLIAACFLVISWPISLVAAVVLGTLLPFTLLPPGTLRPRGTATASDDHRSALHEVLPMVDGDAADRLRELVLDWDLYTLTIADRSWRDEMRRAVVIEMQVVVGHLAAECGLRPRD